MSWVRLDRAFEALQGVRHAGTIVGPAMASVAVSVMLTPAPAQISHRRLLCARLLRLRFLYLIACRDLWLTAFKTGCSSGLPSRQDQGVSGLSASHLVLIRRHSA